MGRMSKAKRHFDNISKIDLSTLTASFALFVSRNSYIVENENNFQYVISDTSLNEHQQAIYFDPRNLRAKFKSSSARFFQILLH